jgi:CRISPR-associated protein Cmr2
LADRELADSLERFVDSLGNVELAYATRLLFHQARRCGTHAEIAERLVKMPAELLAPETYRDPEALEELGFEGDAALPTRALAGFLKTCRDSGIEPPGSYYAVLLMDGDWMGQWLSGNLAPTIGELVHGGARPAGDPGYLDRRRPLSSAHQIAVSRSLNEFSLEIVPPVVEDVHGGVVVYGGGDDLLALLPLHRLLPCLGDLRRLYSGLRLPDGSLAKDRGFESRSGYVKRGERLWRVMGEKATCSMGVVVAHQKWPLRHALETARRMERDVAKDRLDRNAVAIALLKRSGSHEVFGSKWGQDGGVSDPDPLSILQDLVSLIAERWISRRFAYALQEEVPVVWTLPETLEERAYWLIARHWRRSEHPFDHNRIIEAAKRLKELSEQLKAQWPERPGKEDRGGNDAQNAFVAGLGLAEFIARDIRGGAP